MAAKRCLPLLKTVFGMAAIFMLLACSGGSSGGSSGSGELSLSLTDAASDLYQAIYVTIDDIQVHTRGSENIARNWMSVDMSRRPLTVNLLELVNGVREDLGIADLPAGHYTQMRLIIGEHPDDSINILSNEHPFANYVIDKGTPPSAHELKIPSGLNTGIKLVKGFTVSANQTTELVLDFDANRSVVEAGGSGIRLLKPTIAVQDAAEYAIVEGVVRNTADDAPVGGARVSLQVYDATATDAADRVSVRAATLSDADGEYRLFVAPGTYSLVAHAEGYDVAVETVTLNTGETRVADPGLTGSDTGSIDGGVDLFDPDSADPYVTLSFRSEIGGEMIEVKTLNTREGTYAVDLPTGDFQIVASSAGYTTETYNVAVLSDHTTTQDVTLYP